MKRISVLLILYCSFLLYSEEIIVAEKEHITSINIGDKVAEVVYDSTEEGFYCPNGPMVDHEGSLLFYPTSGALRYKSLLKYQSGKGMSIVALFDIMKQWYGATQVQFTSQQGLIQINDLFIDPKITGTGAAFYPQATKNIPLTYESRSYPLPFGSYMESIRPPFVYSTEVLKDRSIKVRNLEETRAWLPTQPGGFSIGSDGLLYRNGVLWSAVKPRGLENYNLNYLGRVMSGHTIWAYGSGIAPGELLIVNPQGNIEINLKIDMPSFFNYGIGPWGELYFLIAPLDYMDPKPGGIAELVVVRNHLKYFGRLNDGGVRLRKEPNTTSDILGTYPAKTGFRILEKGAKEETIGGQTNVWYKVRLLDGKEGWFFGAFVHNLYDGPNGQPPPWPNVPDW